MLSSCFTLLYGNVYYVVGDIEGNVLNMVDGESNQILMPNCISKELRIQLLKDPNFKLEENFNLLGR